MALGAALAALALDGTLPPAWAAWSPVAVAAAASALLFIKAE